MNEFWHERRVGQFKKWNGVCNCDICRDEKYNREDFKRNAMKEIMEKGSSPRVWGVPQDALREVLFASDECVWV